MHGRVADGGLIRLAALLLLPTTLPDHSGFRVPDLSNPGFDWTRPVKFDLIDHVLEQTDDRIVAVKAVTLAEEYLQDHFPTYPVLPGVLMIETLVQAARKMLAATTGNPRLVLGTVRALRYGRFVRPGEALRVEVTYEGPDSRGHHRCKGIGHVIQTGSAEQSDSAAVTGRFTLRPVISGQKSLNC